MLKILYTIVLLLFSARLGAQPLGESFDLLESVADDGNPSRHYLILFEDNRQIYSAHNLPPRRPLSLAPYLAIKSNLLYDMAMIPNIAAEFYIARGYTLSGGWFGAWWSNRSDDRFWRIYGGEVVLRRYLGRIADIKPLTGHHVGLFAQVGTYDFEWRKDGYMSKCSSVVGLEYGYSLPIARRFNLDFVLGVGYLSGEYDRYEPNGDLYCWQERRRLRYFGFTKAELSLAWLIGRDNINVIGGVR
ncbi:MAG: DUF3575 domain-containing protein [Rikenellaceae bacterium]